MGLKPRAARVPITKTKWDGSGVVSRFSHRSILWCVGLWRALKPYGFTTTVARKACGRLVILKSTAKLQYLIGRRARSNYTLDSV